MSPFSRTGEAPDHMTRIVWNSSVINEYDQLYHQLRERYSPWRPSSENADPGVVTDYTIEVMNAGCRRLEDIPAHTFACRQDNDIFIQAAIGLFAGLTLVVTDQGEIPQASYFAYAEGLPVFKQKEHQAWSESIALPVTAYDISMASLTSSKQETLYLRMMIGTPLFYEKTPTTLHREYEVKKISMRLLLKCSLS